MMHTFVKYIQYVVSSLVLSIQTQGVYIAAKRSVMFLLTGRGVVSFKNLDKKNTLQSIKRVNATVSIDISRELLDEGTLVSIIIPFKDKPELLYACIDSILQKTTYRSFEMILVSNNSSDEVVANVRDRYSTQDTIQLYEYNIPFNYAAINNWAVSHAVGTFIVFLNNDMELISPDWVESLLQYAQLSEVGAVGARLYYPDDTIQHAGIHIDPSHEVVHTALGWTKEEMHTSGIDIGVRECSAVTAACLMIKKSVFIDVGMFDEKRFPIDYNDVDLCFRLRSIGYNIIYVPTVELYHYESISRGKWSQMSLAERKTFQMAKHMMWRLWPEYLSEPDPFIECRR